MPEIAENFDSHDLWLTRKWETVLQLLECSFQLPAMVVMQSKILFEERRDDIEKYFDFVKFIIDDKPAFSFRNKVTGVNEEKKIGIDMTHILKANMFILLYNMIEATAANAIEDIHNQLSKNPDLCVDQLCEKITKMALKRIDSNVVGNLNFTNGEVPRGWSLIS